MGEDRGCSNTAARSWVLQVLEQIVEVLKVLPEQFAVRFRKVWVEDLHFPQQKNDVDVLAPRSP